MCGIAGILATNGKQPTEQQIRRMTDAVVHRGPDGSGHYIGEGIALGHRRLSILDISENGAQPMHSKDGRWSIVFNGCIYNYQSIKQDLLSKGCTFVSTSDTEVISEGLSVYGVDIFKKFDGMFAIAAYDNQQHELWLSRDRYGVKPLYYTFVSGAFLFASEIKSFMAYDAFSVQMNTSALNEYFTFQNVFTYQTLFKGVEMLPPANTVKITHSTQTLHHNCWWDFNFNTAEQLNITAQEAEQQTKLLFEKAVASQMVADVPVGSYLSGGMDSGAISYIASKHMPRLCTFTCGFDMSEVTGVEANYDERRDAELMANFIKSEHYEQVMNAGDLKWSLPRLVWHLEDLRVGMSYPNYYISRLASKFVKVCLQGTGGDELFGGYPWRYYKVFDSISQQNFFDQYYGFWQRLVTDEQKGELFQQKVLQEIDLNHPRKVFERVFTFNNNLKFDTPEDHVNNSLYFEIKTFLPGLLLVGDKLAMANSLEERFPFLNNDLVEFAQKIPIHFKLANFQKNLRLNENTFGNKFDKYREFDDGKNVLRQAMSGYMPERILKRKKQGFSAPDESWYRGENASYMRELLLSKESISSEFINPEFVKKIVHEHVDKHINHRLLIWSLMNIEWWCRLFLDGQKIK